MPPLRIVPRCRDSHPQRRHGGRKIPERESAQRRALRRGERLRCSPPRRRRHRCCRLRHGHVLHQAQRNRNFALQSWSRSPRGPHQNLPRPQRWKHPLQRVAPCVAADFPFAVHTISANRDDFARDRQVCVRQTDAVEHHLQRAFPEEMPRVLVGLQMSGQVGTARKNCAPKLLNSICVAE